MPSVERAKFYVIASSHPCATVEAGLRLKRVPYRVVELPAELHRLHQRLRFGQPTVPAIVLNGEKVQGSRAILHRLEELVRWFRTGGSCEAAPAAALIADPAMRSAAGPAMRRIAQRCGLVADSTEP